MSAATLISTEEYLASSYRPDRELVDGRLIERNVGEYEHSNLQGALIAWLRAHQHEWKIRVLPEQRVQVAAGKFRIPDVCIVDRDEPIEPVFTRPPKVCIEVLSRMDTLRSMKERIDDYRAFGVANVWIMDPLARRAWVCSEGSPIEVTGNVAVPASTIRVDLNEIFADLD